MFARQRHGVVHQKVDWGPNRNQIGPESHLLVDVLGLGLRVETSVFRVYRVGSGSGCTVSTYESILVGLYQSMAISFQTLNSFRQVDAVHSPQALASPNPETQRVQNEWLPSR